MAQQVTRYEASDGTLHKSMAAACGYETVKLFLAAAVKYGATFYVPDGAVAKWAAGLDTAEHVGDDESVNLKTIDELAIIISDANRTFSNRGSIFHVGCEVVIGDFEVPDIKAAFIRYRGTEVGLYAGHNIEAAGQAILDASQRSDDELFELLGIPAKERPNGQTNKALSVASA